jgi:hypothetical protein
MDLDQVLVELHEQLDLIDATILSFERLAPFQPPTRVRHQSRRRRIEPARHHRREPMARPQEAMRAGKAMGASPESH